MYISDFHYKNNCGEFLLFGGKYFLTQKKPLKKSGLPIIFSSVDIVEVSD